MSDLNASMPPGDDGSVEADEIQFDQAEYATPIAGGPVCAACQRPIADEYYELGSKVFCSSCRQGVLTSIRGGSRLSRLLKSLVFGSAAAAVGAVIYYVILRATGYNIGLVAVLVGFMVGGAVRKGTGNRGGLFYQVLAVFLTYTAIGAMHIPLIFDEPDEPEVKNQQVDSAPKKVEKSPAAVNALPKAPRLVANNPARPLPDIPPNPFANAPADGATERLAPVQNVKNERPAAEAEAPAITIPAFLVVIVVFIFATPIFHVFQAPISGLIFGFALWEAWKINKRVQISFNGPFRVTANGSNEFASEVAGGE